jgi:hypothetical protein
MMPEDCVRMASELEATPKLEGTAEQGPTVEVPRPTVAPLVLSLGIVLLAGGAILGLAFLLVGAAVFVAGIGFWVFNLVPGRGHMHEALAEADQQPRPIISSRALVEQLSTGMPGYRVQLPQKVQPISAGVKGGIVGGLVMPVPALLYSLWNGHGIWYPLNLLAGMLLPGVGDMNVAELESFHLSLFISGFVIHAMMVLVLGLIYGVLLPTLPDIPGEAAWGGLLMPLLWSGISFIAMGLVNPAVRNSVSWPWFMMSQFVFGVVAAIIVHRNHKLGHVAAGALGGAVGGVLMTGPAIVWGLWSGRGIWYPINLLAGMVVPGLGDVPGDQLNRFHANWFIAATIIHGVMSVGFGIIYGLSLHRLPRISGALTWGGLLFPLLWTGVSFGLMGIVNPVLQARVDWPWFVVSQFVFGATAAYVVGRSEMISIPPAGSGLT